MNPDPPGKGIQWRKLEYFGQKTKLSINVTPNHGPLLISISLFHSTHSHFPYPLSSSFTTIAIVVKCHFHATLHAILLFMRVETKWKISNILWIVAGLRWFRWILWGEWHLGKWKSTWILCLLESYMRT